MFKIFLALFILGWVIGLIIITGETYAMDNKHPRFTRWWRKHVIGEEK